MKLKKFKAIKIQLNDNFVLILRNALALQEFKTLKTLKNTLLDVSVERLNSSKTLVRLPYLDYSMIIPSSNIEISP